MRVEEVLVERDGQRRATHTLQHVPSAIGALEAEEVGVEHLLRDIKDATVSTLSNKVTAKLQSLRYEWTKAWRVQHTL